VCGQLGKLSLHQIEADKPAEPLPELTAQQIADEISNEENFRLQITNLEEQLNRMKPNLAAIAEYRKKVSFPSHPSIVLASLHCFDTVGWATGRTYVL